MPARTFGQGAKSASARRGRRAAAARLDPRASARPRRAPRAARRGSSIRRGRAAEAARDRRELDLGEAGPGPVLAVALHEPVHDRVAAVREHDEEDADPVVRRAPERPGSRRSPSRRRRRRRPGAPGAPCARPAAAGTAKPSPPIAALRKPSGSRASSRSWISGRSTGASSTTTASRGSRSASAASTWLAVSGSPGAGGAAAEAGAERLRRLGVALPDTRRASSRQTAAGGASTASSTGLRCSLVAVFAELRATRVPSLVKRPARHGDWRKTPARRRRATTS